MQGPELLIAAFSYIRKVYKGYGNRNSIKIVQSTPSEYFEKIRFVNEIQGTKDLKQFIFEDDTLC